MAHARKNSPVRGKTLVQSFTMPKNKSNEDDKMQLATNANVQPTHDSDTSSISSDSLLNANTSSNVSDTMVKNTDIQMLKQFQWH